MVDTELLLRNLGPRSVPSPFGKIVRGKIVAYVLSPICETSYESRRPSVGGYFQKKRKKEKTLISRFHSFKMIYS